LFQPGFESVLVPFFHTIDDHSWSRIIVFRFFLGTLSSLREDDGTSRGGSLQRFIGEAALILSLKMSICKMSYRCLARRQQSIFMDQFINQAQFIGFMRVDILAG